METTRYVRNLEAGMESTLSGGTPAVMVRNGYKAYTPRNPILKDFNMTVPKGTIYGLLGASGCGKTTMLSCIVGLRQLNSGEIRVYGAKPGTKESGIPGKRLGYMPQDIALYPLLSIKELLQYFGRLYGMTDREVANRIEFLAKFLQLPDPNRFVSNLSGGQQRRTSLATALIHDPQLLILDEPTVGVDPLLRESIWDHLVHLTENGRTTIIITTHYIEEARQSHTVGLMRNGKLLAEDSPESLLRKHNANLLEDIVLQLCRKDQGILKSSVVGPQNDNNPVMSALAETSFYPKRRFFPKIAKAKGNYNVQGMEQVVGLRFDQRKTSLFGNQGGWNTPGHQNSEFMDSNDGSTQKDRVKALIIRNLINFWRNPIFLFGCLLLPAFQQVITCSTIGKDVKEMRIGVIDNETPNWDRICPNSNFGCKSGNLTNLSCRYINSLSNETFHLIPFKTREEALQLSATGKLRGFLTFSANYSHDMMARAIAGNHALEESIIGSTVLAKLDHSDYMAATLMLVSLYTSFQKYVAELGVECGGDARSFEIPLTYRTPVYGTTEPKFLEYAIPGGLTMLIFIIPMATCALSYIADKQQGTMERSRSAGVTTFDFMLAFFFTEGLVILAEVCLSTGVLLVFFDFEIKGSYVLYVALMVLVGLAGQSYGYILGLICSYETSALLAIFFMVPILSNTGVVWPLEAVPEAFRMMSNFIPVTLPIASMRSIITRGLGLTHPTVWPGFAVIIVTILTTWIISGVVYKMTK